ncbi:YbaK/EbsC family protein [Nitrospirillum viridazoti]|uniref:Prolyl-tRNA editing enzyme YbaK/EbsC (Cys-tRNA(Pro) deacylase) n=1 Tax=Nitrospirillum amazonense TaxID=28077 RepID=A0A560HZX7_9PROT|nr:YbaK/EbsC family protein [Nitrospirillum amazonense]TWB52212.1 prolyl-tRNA editing enzyme YbaK/EbsC (Cys-tRNA(Pro) deacylase) [Nitrospirillum amazonense]
MAGPLSPSAQKIQNLLNDLGQPIHVVEFAATTRTAAEAAAVIGCDAAQIAKSIVFRTREKNAPVLVVASGATRINEALVAKALADTLNGDRLLRADPEYVRLTTGFPIGGVPPLGHAVTPVTLFDRRLLSFPTVWAAAGTPNAVFAIAPDVLARLAGARVVDVA